MKHKDKAMWFLLGAAAAALLGMVFWSGLSPKTTGASNQAMVSCKPDTGCSSDPNSLSGSGTGSSCPKPDPDTKYACKCSVTKTTDSGTETLNQFTLPNMTPATCDKVGGLNGGENGGK